jgi:Ca2+-binding RTX toxin-like protein
MPTGSIAQAIKLITGGITVDSTFSYHFAATLPSYYTSGSGFVVTGYSLTPNGSNYVFSATDFVSMAALAGSAMTSATSAVGRVALVSFSQASTTSADIVIGGLSVDLYTPAQVAAFTFDPMGINPAQSDMWITQVGQSAITIDRTIQHELLHAVGLGDAKLFYSGVENTGQYTIMAYVVHPEENRLATELQLYDIAALQAIYGRDDSYEDGDTTISQFAETSGAYTGSDRIFAIWDGGGIDTIDVSGISQAALIDLRPGYFSSIGPNAEVVITAGQTPSVVNDGRENISIAFGAYIENAKGSSAADLIIGNILTNKLEGGAGADVIYGEGADSIYDNGNGLDNYRRIVTTGTHWEDASTAVKAFINNPASQVDHLLGGAGDDYLHGGRGNDLIEGGADDDHIVGGAGDDEIWGGAKDNDLGAADGVETMDYSSGGAGVTLTYQSDSGSPSISVADGEGGTDTLHSIERIVVDRGGQDKLQFAGSGANAKVDLTDIEDGFILAGQDGKTVRLKGIDEYIGGESLTTFIGKTGAPTVFRAGSGGGDFTLTSGDRAYGFTGAVDTFRVTTTIPTEFASWTDAQKVEYLRQNRVFISNFGDEDHIFVNQIQFTGNSVTSTLAPIVASDYNRDLPITYVELTGSSSYGTAYAQATFDVRGQSWGGADWGSYVYSGTSIRDVNFHRGDENGVSLISFMARTITPVEDSYIAGYTLDALAPTDEMLVIVIDGFEDGEGGISFSNDALANFGRPTVFDEDEAGFYSFTHGVSWGQGNPEIWVGEFNDLDGNEDGYLNAGGAGIDSDSELFNLGAMPFGNSQTDWEAYVLGAETFQGTEDPDTLDGGAGADTLEGDDGNDTLIGGDGNDALFGGAGDDLLIGNAGDDLLDGGVDEDEMEGGTGNDTYAVDDANDVVTEAASEGNDTVAASLASYTLGANLENLAYTGLGNFTGTGNALDNLLAGGDGDDTLSSGDGNDRFQSSGGTDLLDGGAGTDTLCILGDEDVIEIAENGGVYTITDWNFWPSEIVLTSVELIWFSDLDESFTIAELLDPNFTGTNGDDAVEGNNLGNGLDGLDGDDVLIGAGGYDWLDGGQGTDTAWFACASDEYRLFLDTGGAAVAEALLGNEATDYLWDVEALYFADDDVTILVSALPALGTSGIDALAGSARADQLYALEGDDSLAGLAGDDILMGDSGNDSYAGGTGDDFVYDWTGDEAYLYAVGDGHDTIRDDAGTDYLEFGGGIAPIDVTVTVDSSGSYLLSFADGSVLIESGMFEDYAVEEIRFADTTIWTDEDLYDMAFGQSLMGSGFNALGAESWQPGESSAAEIRLAPVADFHMCIP